MTAEHIEIVVVCDDPICAKKSTRTPIDVFTRWADDDMWRRRRASPAVKNRKGTTKVMAGNRPATQPEIRAVAMGEPGAPAIDVNDVIVCRIDERHNYPIRRDGTLDAILDEFASAGLKEVSLNLLHRATQRYRETHPKERRKPQPKPEATRKPSRKWLKDDGDVRRSGSLE